MATESNSVRVVCRFRPINAREKKEKIKGQLVPWDIDQENKTIISLESDFRCTLDETLWFETQQDEAFARIAETSIKDVLNGYNGTIFAYGQTGSGKTWTMFGPDKGVPNPELYGLIPRAAEHLFREIGRLDDIVESSISITILEIYREQICDLLCPETDPAKIKVWDTIEGVFIENLSSREVKNAIDVLDCINISAQNRTVSATHMNAESSRSHCVFTIYVKLKMQDGSVRKAKLNFGDLAGSEKTGKTGAKGKQLEEAKAINKSLTNLGVVMKQLVEGRSHVPFRDSKLTFLLKDSLGGNCKTTLVVACSPHQFNSEETTNTLKFAARAKKIKTKIKKNEVLSSTRLLKENEALKKRIQSLEQALKSKGIQIMAEKSSLKLILPDVDPNDEEGIIDAKGAMLKEIRANEYFELCKIQVNTQEGDSLVFEIDFMPSEITPNPAEYRDRLRDMIKNNAILSEAELFGDIDPRVLERYETEIAELQKEASALEAKILEVEASKKAIADSSLEERFLFSLTQVEEEVLNDLAKKLEDGDRNKIMTGWLNSDNFQNLEKSVEAVRQKCGGLVKNPVSEITDIIYDLQTTGTRLNEREEALTSAEEKIAAQKQTIDQLRSFIAGRPVDDDEVIDIKRSPLVRLRQIFDFFANDEELYHEKFNVDQFSSGLLCLGAQLSDVQLPQVFGVLDLEGEGLVSWECFQEFMKNTSEDSAVVKLVQATIEMLCQEWVLQENEAILDQHAKILRNKERSRDGFVEMIQKLNTSGELEMKEIDACNVKIEALEKKIQRARTEYDDHQELIDNNENDRRRKMKRARITEPDEQMKNDMFNEQVKLRNIKEKVERLNKVMSGYMETIMVHEEKKEIVDHRVASVKSQLEETEEAVKEASAVYECTTNQAELAREAFKTSEEKRQRALDILTALDDADKRDPHTGLFTKAEYDYQSASSLNESGAIHLSLDIDGFMQYNHSKGHLAANMCLKQLADFLAEITDELNVEAVWFRVESHMFTGVLITATMEETMRFCRKLCDKMLTTGLTLSIGMAPYQEQKISEWRNLSNHCMGVSHFANRNRNRFGTIDSDQKMHETLRKQRLEWLDMDAHTIDLMINQIQTLKSSNQTLTDIYTTLKTLNLTGVIEENVQTVKHSIEEFEVRSEMLKDFNSFDQSFVEIHGSLHSLEAILLYVFNFRKIRHLYHYFDRIDYIKILAKKVEKEWEECEILQETDAMKLEIGEERFEPIVSKYEDCAKLVEDLDRQSWLRQLEIQKEIAFLSGYLFDKHVDTEEDEIGYLSGPRIDDLLDDMEVQESERQHMKTILDRSRNGAISKADFVLWVLSKEYSVEIHSREEVFGSLKWSSEDDKLILIAQEVTRNGAADEIGIIPGSRVIGVNGELIKKAKSAQSIVKKLKKLEEPFRLNLITVASCTSVEDQKAFLNKLKVRESYIRKGTGNMEIELIDPDEEVVLPDDSPGDAEGDENLGDLPETPQKVMSTQSHKRHESAGVRIHTNSLHSRTDSTAPSEVSDTDSKIVRKYKGYRLGEKVALATKQQGTIKYIGKVNGLKGTQFGIHLQGRFGTHDGFFKGVRYFTCKPKTGTFVTHNQIKKVVKTLEEQIEAQVKQLCGSVRTGHYESYLEVLRDQCVPIDIIKTSSETHPPLIIQSVNGSITEGRRMVMLDMIHRGVGLQDRDVDGRTALHHAGMSGKTELLELLCKHNSSLNVRDNLGRTAIHLAAMKGQYHIVHMLACNHADLAIVDEEGKTAFMLAALRDYFDIVQLLCDHKADMNVRDAQGRTAVALCALAGQTKMVELLIKNGADLNIQDNMGQTALHLATDKGSAELVELLCRNGCDPDIQDDHQRSAAHLYAYQCKLPLIKVLCLYNADLSLTSAEGYTPLLSCAERRGKRGDDGWTISFNPVGVELVKLLIASEADPNAVDESGKHALIHAASHGNTPMVQELLRCGADRTIADSRTRKKDSLELSYDALKSASSKMHYDAANALKTVEEKPNVYLDNLRSWRVMEILCQGDELSMAYSATERTTICDTILEFVFGVPEIPEVKEEEPETFTFAVRGASAQEVNGVYKYRSLREGYPCYDQLVNGKTYTIVRKAPKGRKNPVWHICNRESDFYYNSSSVNLPPALRWSKCKGIPTPAPHVTKGEFGSWFAYAELGDVDKCRGLLESGIHQDIPDRNGNTAGHLAARVGQTEILKLLMENGADFNLLNYHDERALLVAGKYGGLRAYDALLECGADKATDEERELIRKLSNCDDSINIREQIVFIAIDRNMLRDIQYARESGMDLTAKNADGQHPIQYALSKSRFYIVNSILTGSYSNGISKEEWRDFFKSVSTGEPRGVGAGFKKGIHIDMPNRLGRTSLMTAVLKGHKPVIKLLLDKGANVNIQDNDGRSLLMLLCLKGTEEQLNFLLEKATIDVNLIDRFGNSALHNCILKQRMPLIKAMLEQKGLDTSITNKKGESVLHLAVMTNKASIVSLVLTTSCDIDLRDENGCSALYYAVVKENTAVIKTLVERGASLNESETQELSARWLSSAHDGNMKAVNSMIAAGVNVEQTNRNGLSGILVATTSGQKEVLHALLAAGADVNVTDQQGQTSVHIAATKNDAELIQILIAAKADLNITNSDNQTALDVAQLEGFEEISTLLIEAGATNAKEEDDEAFEEALSPNDVGFRAELMRQHSMSVLLSRKDSPVLRVSGGGDLDGLYKLQPEPHAGRKLYKSESLVIRWCEEAWIFDEEVRNEPKGAAVLMADIESPACECDASWMLLENGDWIEAPGLRVQPAVLDIEDEEVTEDVTEEDSEEMGGDTMVVE